MKKLFAISLSLLFFVSLSFAVVGCKKEEPKPEAAVETPAPAAPAPEAAPAAPAPEAAPAPGAAAPAAPAPAAK